MLIIIETLLLLTISAAVICSLLPHRKFGTWSFRFAALAVLLVLVDVISGNWRWQIIPVYMLSVIMLLITRYRGQSQGPSNWKRKLLFSGYGLLATVALVFAALLPRAFPMIELPSPAGPHSVGTMDIHLVDETRNEGMTEDPSDYRELMVRAWYPATVSEGAVPEPFVRESEPVHSIFARGIPLPGVIFNHLKKTPGHSYLDAKPVSAASPYPVLIFSHGNSFYASQNTLLMEHLASQGYVVFSIDHPYQASWVKFPDGRVVTYKEDWVDFGAEDEEESLEKMKAFVQSFLSDSYEEYYAQISETLGNAKGVNEGLKIWLDDTTFLLDTLTSGADPKIASLQGLADLEQVGVFGMSLGGAAAGMFCAVDSRCKAGLNMDGSQYGENAIDIRLNRPFMMMNADRRLDMIPMLDDEIDPEQLLSFEMNDFLLHQTRDIGYSLVVAGSTHGSYSDFGVMSNLGRWIGALGSIEGWEMKGILDDYVLAFFNKHLKGLEEPLLDGPSDQHPAVIKFTSRDGR
jgi:predicted dienelactone hydrolase